MTQRTYDKGIGVKLQVLDFATLTSTALFKSCITSYLHPLVSSKLFLNSSICMGLKENLCRLFVELLLNCWFLSFFPPLFGVDVTTVHFTIWQVTSSTLNHIHKQITTLCLNIFYCVLYVANSYTTLSDAVLLLDGTLTIQHPSQIILYSIQN